MASSAKRNAKPPAKHSRTASANKFQPKERHFRYHSVPNTDATWKTTTAAGADPVLLAAALTYAQQANSNSLVILHGGRILSEQYPGGWSRTTTDQLYSASKAMGAALMGKPVSSGEFTALAQIIARIPSLDLVIVRQGTQALGAGCEAISAAQKELFGKIARAYRGRIAAQSNCRYQTIQAMNTTTTIISLSAIFACLGFSEQKAPQAVPPGASNKVYDPLALSVDKPPAPLDFTITDATRQRELPIRIYLPADKTVAPVVLFSHGLGGNREGSAFLGHHWAARGYVAVFLQHPGSDDGVWRNQSLLERNRTMRDAASGPNFLLRVKDVPAVLDQLALWLDAKDHPLAGRLDLNRVGMSGHSFGAVTTQAVSGQTAAVGGQLFTDRRIKAAIAFSPSEPTAGTPAQAFGKVTLPWLLMTGTKDVARIGGGTIGASTVEKRLSVFPALPPGSKYELVLDGAAHSAFTDRALPGDSGSRNPNHHRAILALSTAFWDAYVKGDAAARAWLDGSGPRTVLETKDRWQKK